MEDVREHHAVLDAGQLSIEQARNDSGPDRRLIQVNGASRSKPYSDHIVCAEVHRMKNLKLIVLLGTMDSLHGAALAHARRLACAYGAKLHILVTVHSGMIAAAALLSRAGAARAREGLLQQTGQLLQQEAASIRAQGVEVSTEILWTRPAAMAVLQRIEALNPDLLVKNAEAEQPLAWMGRSLDRALLRQCRAPVLIAHRDSGAPQHVAAAIDMNRPWPSQGDFAQQLADEAESLAGVYGASLHLIQAEPAAHPEPQRRHHRVVPTPPVNDAFANLADAHTVPGPWRHRLSGAAVPAILDFLGQHGIDLLVIGNPRRPAAQRWLSGNHAERLNLHADCDILAFPAQAG